MAAPYVAMYLRMSLERHRLPLQPLHRQLVLLEEVLRLGVDICVIFIQPVLLSSRQESLVDQFSAVGDHCYVFEAEIRLVTELVLRFRFFHHNDVLDSDAEGAIFIVAWLVGDHVSWSQGDFGILNSCSNADRSFVDVEI